MNNKIKELLNELKNGIPLIPLQDQNGPILSFQRDPSVPHAPVRVHGLNRDQKMV